MYLDQIFNLAIVQLMRSLKTAEIEYLHLSLSDRPIRRLVNRKGEQFDIFWFISPQQEILWLTVTTDWDDWAIVEGQRINTIFY